MTFPAAAVVGTGFIGPVHVEALRRIGVPVLGVLGSTLVKGQQAAKALNLPRAYADLDELLADPAVAVVHIASPNRLHFEQCRRVLAAGRHVVCEKPLAMNTVETAELVRLAAESGRLAAVCYNCRFYPLCLEARARLASGSFGPVRHVAGSYAQDWLSRPADFNWRVLAGEGGELRAVADIGTHWLDLVQFVTGLEVSAVFADLQTVHAARLQPAGGAETFSGSSQAAGEPVGITTEDAAGLLLRFRGGPRGTVWVSQVTPGRKNRLCFEVATAEATLAWDGERPDELWIGRRDGGSELMRRDPSLLSPQARAYTAYPGGHAEGFPDTFKQLFRAVYGAVAAGGPLPVEVATFADGHREVLLCEAVSRSMREGRWASV